MQRINSNQIVTSVGNSWVVCRSKSHPGRIYYFNTLSGEAAWNLSEVEIEKAKRTTKIIENSGVCIEGCPEPKDPPQDHLCQLSPSDAYNIQTVIKTNALMNNNKPTIIPPFTGVQCSCNPVNPVGLGVPVASGLNPNIWNVPVAVPCNRLDVNEFRFVQTTSVPLHQRFGNESTNADYYNFSLPGVKKFNSRTCNKSSVKKLFHNNRSFNNLKDLRQLLPSKRCPNSVNNKDAHGNNLPNARFINGRKMSISDTIDWHPGLEDSINLTSTNKVQNTPPKIKLNLTGLRNIAKKSIHEDFWHIVPDANVLLHHHKFIKVLLDSDEKCRLMVPEHVIADIRNASRSSNSRVMNHARRAMTFLSQNIRAGSVTIAKDPSSDNAVGKSFILDCCLKLLAQHFYIVLLCNDKELQSHEKATNIPIFTVNEMKSFLSSTVADDELQTSAAPFPNGRRMKISIPNNSLDTFNTDMSNSEDNTSKPSKIVDTNRKINMVSTGSQTNDIIKQILSPVDVGVQTDLCCLVFNKALNSQNSSDFATKSVKIDNEQVNTIVSPKRKVITLNGTLSNQSSTNDNNLEKRNYKWRRKRSRCLVDDVDALPEKESNTSQHSSDSSLCRKKLRHDDISKAAHTVDTPQKVYHVLNNLRNKNNDIIVEETSTSGVISNTASNNDCESRFTLRSMNTQKAKEKENNKNVMFEVTSPAMEEHLKTKCDEWISRFIQIMEEALTQMLQKDHLNFSKSMPPPWTLYEAAQCIKIKFRIDSDTVDAAYKLSETLLKNSDDKGSINLEINPSNYMEMYSYGVYLIDSLQAVISDSEDLQTASESLAKLLSDIQHTNTDTSHNDSFVDITHEAVVDLSDAVNAETTERVEKYVQNQGQEIRNAKLNDSPSKYNLRSYWKKTIQNDRVDETEVRADSPIDTKSKFFTTLQLQKRSNYENKNAADIDKLNITTCNPPLSHSEEFDQQKHTDLTDAPTLHKPKSPVNKQSCEPKIIRNFTKCLDFEEKLINKEREILGLNDTANPYLDNEYTEEESLDEYDHIEGNEDNDAHLSHNENRLSNVDDNYKFKCIIRRVLCEIREAFLEVYSFCKESQKRLSVPRSAMDTVVILLKAKETQMYINNLCDALNSICARDAETSDNDIAVILNIEGVELDKSYLEEYRDLIVKCADQANVLRETVETIISQTQ